MNLRRNPARSMVSPPPGFDGSLASFFEAFVEPNLPHPTEVEVWHERIVAHCNQPHSVMLVRRVRGLERRLGAVTTGGGRLMPTDNSPGWWMHYVAFNGIRSAEF